MKTLPATRSNKEKEDIQKFVTGRWYWEFVERETPCIYCGVMGCRANCMREKEKTFFHNFRSNHNIGKHKKPFEKNKEAPKYEIRCCKYCKRKFYPKFYKREPEKVLAKYYKMNFCSLDCEISFEYPDGRSCKNCGRELRRRSRERKGRYLARDTCSTSCGTAVLLKKNFLI